MRISMYHRCTFSPEIQTMLILTVLRAWAHFMVAREYVASETAWPWAPKRERRGNIKGTPTWPNKEPNIDTLGIACHKPLPVHTRMEAEEELNVTYNYEQHTLLLISQFPLYLIPEEPLSALGRSDGWYRRVAQDAMARYSWEIPWRYNILWVSGWWMDTWITLRSRGASS